MLKSLGDDPQFVETFQREAQAAARLNHRHIAQIYAFGQENGQPYIAMELVSGGSLDRMMSEQGPLDPAVVIHVGEQIAEGLSVAAEAGMIHGDVKPENILFDADKNAKLVDFGLSAMQSGPGNDVWGTPYYIAPEKVRRLKSDYRSDIYSLGGTLYHAITGVPPFEGVDATAVVKARFDGPPKPIRDLRPGTPDEVEALIARMLAVEPQMRYPTYGSLLGDMKRFLAKAGPVKLDKGSKKIMIKGKHGGMTGKMSATGSLHTTGAVGELPPGMAPVEAAAEEPAETEAEAGKRGCRMMGLIVAGVVLLAGVVAGGIFGFMAYSENKRQASEHAKIVQSQETVRISIAKAVANAKVIVGRLHDLEPEAMEYPRAAADEVVKALGEGARAAMVPPEPDYEALGAPAAAAPAADTNAVAVGTNAVDGASNAVPAEAEAVVAAPDDGSGDVHPVVAIVRGMYEDAYTVKAAAAVADRVLQAIEQQAHTAERFTNVTVQDDEALRKLNNALVERVNGLGNDRQMTEAPRKVTQLKRTLESVKSDVASLIALKRQEALEAEKRAQADAVAEKKRQEKEAYDKKIAEEKARIAETEAANLETLRRLQFREALRALKGVKDELETPEAQEAALTAQERVNRVKDFLEFLVKRAPGYKSRYGWAIEGADAKQLSVGGQKVAWTDVFMKQQKVVVELVNGLIRDDQAMKSLSLRERTRAMTNAALCFKLFYSEVPSAMEMAKALATGAASQFDLDADSIKQLLPEFFQ
jgi:hypothetical protein